MCSSDLLRAARRRQRARPESNGIRRGKLALADLGEAGEVEPRVVAGDAMASAIGAAVVHRGRAWLPKVMLARYPYAVPGRAGGDRDVKEAAQRHIALVDGVLALSLAGPVVPQLPTTCAVCVL